MNNTQVKMNKPIFLAPSILEISKTVVYEFWYHCTNPKCQDKVNLCYVDTDSIMINIKTNDLYKVF